MRTGLLRGGRLLHDASDQPLRGTFLIELPCPATVRAIALAGFDFVILDLEHSAFTLETLPGLITEARACQLVSIVRIPAGQLGLIGNVLDLGANGVMVPHISTAQQAQDVVVKARFAPLGRRGFSPLTIFDPLSDPQTQLNQETVVILQIEGQEGLSNAAAIASTEGVDAVFVGPYDLAESVGTPSDIDSPAVLDGITAIAAAVGDGTLLGLYFDDPAKSTTWATRGFRLQCIGFDGQMLLARARTVMRTAQGSAAGSAAVRPVGSSTNNSPRSS